MFWRGLPERVAFFIFTCPPWAMVFALSLRKTKDMDSSIDFSVADAKVTAMELDSIEFSSLTTGDALGIEITVYDGNTSSVHDSWYTTYYADHDGKVVLSDLARVWNSYILEHRHGVIEEDSPASLLGGLKVKIAYTIVATGVTANCVRHIWYATRKDGMTVAALNLMAPYMNLRKRTFMDAEERLYVAGHTLKAVTVVATYVKNGAVSTTSYSVTAAVTDYWGYCYDLSPAYVAEHLPSGGVLKEYTATLADGTNSCTWLVEQQHYAQRTELWYVNRRGVYESLWLTGAEEWKPERTADYGWAGDELAALDVDVRDGFVARVGYVDEATLEQLRDLSASPRVWKWHPSTQAWRRVTITGVDFTRVCPTNQARTAVVEYEYASRFEV